MDVNEALKKLGPMSAFDLFPDLDEHIKREILHSEQRIKYWVVFGVLSNLVALGIAAIPSVFFLGQLSRDTTATAVQVTAQGDRIESIQQQATQQMIRQQMSEQWMISQGYQPPNQR